MEIVKVQHHGTNTFISLPRETRELLEVKKGDKVILKVEEGRLIVEKC